MLSFRYAADGLRYCFATQRNMVIHLVVGIAVITLAFLLGLKRWELLLIITAVFAVLVVETINTAVEKMVDLVIEEHHKLARITKDVAAAAVLLTAGYAVLVGLLTLGPRLWGILIKLIHF